MLAVKSVNVRDNFKEWCDKISMGETVVISRPRNENINIINKAKNTARQKPKRKPNNWKRIKGSGRTKEKAKTFPLTLEE